MLKSAKHTNGTTTPRRGGRFAKKAGVMPTAFTGVRFADGSAVVCESCGTAFRPLTVRTICTACKNAEESEPKPVPTETPCSRMMSWVREDKPTVQKNARDQAAMHFDACFRHVELEMIWGDDKVAAVTQAIARVAPDLDADVETELERLLHEEIEAQELGRWR